MAAAPSPQPSVWGDGAAAALRCAAAHPRAVPPPGRGAPVSPAAPQKGGPGAGRGVVSARFCEAVCDRPCRAEGAERGGYARALRRSVLRSWRSPPGSPRRFAGSGSEAEAGEGSSVSEWREEASLALSVRLLFAGSGVHEPLA